MKEAHGDSEGTYIGFGTMDRYDGMEWVKWMIHEIVEDAQILLHGNFHGRRHCLHDGRNEASATGERDCF